MNASRATAPAFNNRLQCVAGDILSPRLFTAESFYAAQIVALAGAKRGHRTHPFG